MYSHDFVKYITTILHKSINKLQSVSFFMLLTVHCITTLASCLTISEHIYNRGCVSFGPFPLKKSVLINKFNTFKLNNKYCKMGYLSTEENGINMDNASMNTVPISPDYSYMITNVEND